MNKADLIAKISEDTGITKQQANAALDSFKKNLEEYLQVKHVIPCANGTDALQIAMMALDLQPGDEVITADFTYAATCEVIALLKLTPVLVEVNSDTFNISV
mgnify:CR=1 FL=1